MLEKLEMLPPDPILGLTAEFKADPNPNKVNLGVGVYKDDAGETPIFQAIKQAEAKLIAAQTTKAYIPQAGDPDYLAGITELVLGSELASSASDRVKGVMTPGGSGALRMIAELIMATKADATVWVSSPTWGNHFPLLSSAGLTLESYPYYDAESGLVDFDSMMTGLAKAKPGDVVLLHACCHNPTGADLTNEQWDQVVAFAKENQLVAFIDMAYQGLGAGLDEDAYGIRKAVSELPEVLVAVSSSKTFGVYRERAGLAMIASSPETVSIAQSHIMSIARRTYSMSAFHGAGVIGALLADADLKAMWVSEIDTARNRINGLRNKFADQLNDAQSVKNFDFLKQNQGMFSILGLSKEQAIQMRADSGLYILNSSRVNVAGLSENNLDAVVKAIVSVM